MENAIDLGKKVERISTSKIELNELNPRKIIDEEADDRLLQSIYEKGIIVPLILFYDSHKNKYFLIDGERRFKCAQKLNLDVVPAYILEKKPTELENILLMFHIHMVRKDWSDIATALAIRGIKNQLGTDNVKDIAKYTNLKPYKIIKYLKILDYPQAILDKFLESEARGGENKLDTDTLVELSRPIRLLEDKYPDIYREFNKEKIVNIVIQKKKNGKIINNREIRFLTKILESDKKASVDRPQITKAIIHFFKNEDTTLPEVYDTFATSYFLINLVRKIEIVKKDLSVNLPIKKMSKDEFNGLISNLSGLKEFIESKIRDIKRSRP